MEKKVRIGIDVDGVLFPFSRAFSTYLGQVFEEDDCPSWKVYPYFVSKEDAYKAMDYAHSGKAILKYGLYPYCQEEIEKISREASLIIMTRRSEKRGEETKKALNELGIYFDKFYAEPDLDKGNLCVKEKCQILIDDKPQTLIEASDLGVKGMSLSFSYNKDTFHNNVEIVEGGWPALGKRIRQVIQELKESH